MVIGPVKPDADPDPISRMYEDLRELKGIGDKSVTDASETIDEVLYGENGAWKGVLLEEIGDYALGLIHRVHNNL